MTRWQYTLVSVGTFSNRERMVEALGSLGADGWELAATYDKASNWFAGFEKGFLLFKREVPDGAEPVGPWCAEFQYAPHDGNAW